MPSMPGKNGGKRPGAGRKSGEAGKSQRDPSIRAVGRAVITGIVEGDQKHPLEILVELANDERVEFGDRIRAAVGALPFMMPRQSMSVTADITPKGGPADVDPAVQLGRMIEAMNRLSASAERTVETTAKSDENGA